jgi:hypothetical protein
MNSIDSRQACEGNEIGLKIHPEVLELDDESST